MNDNPDHFEILRKIKYKPNSSQRQLATDLGFSLGKLNYCLNALKDKVLTPKGLSKKTKLTLNFMKRKMKEYDELKSEFESEK